MKRLIHKVQRLRRYFRLFSRPADMVAYYRCRHRPYLARTVELHPKASPHPVLCRPGTSDAAALWGAFGEQFHRPPAELPRDAVILDLGANVGYTAVDFANRYPTARVIAVELDAGNAHLARRNLERFGARCTVVHAAAWSSNGEVTYEGDAAWAFRVASPAPGARTAPSVTIPALLEQFEIDRVDYLKMDIEGSEAELLVHSASWLDRVDSIKVEVHPPATLAACAAVLEKYGFAISTDERHAGALIGIRAEARLVSRQHNKQTR